MTSPAHKYPQTSVNHVVDMRSGQVPIGIVPLSAVAVDVLSPVAPREGIFRRMYGKDNRVLYSAKLSEGFKVVAAKRTRQVAGISGGSAKIRVTARKLLREVESCVMRGDWL
jgi:hypothetical protein